MSINTHPHIHEQVVCANMFVRKDGKYLLLRRSSLKKYAPNYVHPVGGKVDKNENPFVAAQRELMEETGISVVNVRLEAVILEIRPEQDEPYNWLIFHFSGDYDKGDVKRTEEGELVLLSADELKKEKLSPSVKPIIEHILDREKGTIFTTVEYEKDQDHVVLKQTLDYCAIG